jgi:hypothetical protein
MKRSSTIFLQVVLVLIGIGAVAILLWEPHVEGRNAHATVFQIYFNDPFLAYVYTASIAFFMALFQAFKVLGFVRQNKTFSQPTVKALRTIKYCAMTLIAFVAGAILFIFIFGEKEERPAGFVVPLIVTFASVVVTTATAICERILQNAVDIKSENDLTV